MKKLLISSVTALLGLLPAMAQTEFRHITFDEAKSAAKAENKHIFIDFFTEWCGPCKRLASNVFPTKQVGDYLNSNYICLKIDAEKGEGVELANKFAVRAYPTLVVANADGELLGSFAGLKEGDEFITAVEMCNNPEMQPERVKQRYESGDRDTRLVVAYATILRDDTRAPQEGNSKATAILDEYFNSLTDKERLDKENLSLFTTFAWDYSSPRVRFLIDRHTDFATENQPQLNEVMKNAFSNEAYRYFTGNTLRKNTANLTDYNTFKQEADHLGFTSDLSRILRFTDQRAQCDDKAYLDFCDNNLAQLDESELTMFVYSISSIFQSETVQQKSALSSFLRKHIADMPARPLYFAAAAVMSLEDNSH